ncbi:flagellar hook assembly protein FlgD [Roseibium denhamense]|uniref:Basal-body rod modification protein FlgD n=1 Tax=Roseibium denhamense TaxID=76305 RepID=A0ABY1NGB0_9HYPH|nr:flagellar hook capping FlgD N-terminal domain-containing protein [Roseibium denhamense]MTI06368.1 flagellar hook assembly protein FlgD [Roseibium denhamense]SMP08650.1 flagellar basal-body rod modification protein FlgD [Roseibium denhamense]
MTIVSSSTTTTTQSAASASQTGLDANYDLFLSILTTQIQNQDPLDPMDSAEYTSQLVEYSAVEQSIKTNENLEDMMALLETNQNMGYLNFLGAEVTADASSAILAGGETSWQYEVAEDAAGKFEIRNSSGTVVYSGDIELPSGSGTIPWDGTTDSGATAANGTYTIHFDLLDSAGRQEPVKTVVQGVVDGLDMSSGEAILSVDGREIPVSKVQSVSTASS